MNTRILVATDGTAEARGALRLAQALSERWHAPVAVVAVMEPFPLYGVGSAELIARSRRELDHAGEVALHARVEAQLAELGPEYASWSVTVEIGTPAPTIARLAIEKEAALVAVGLGRHSLGDRWFGTETALRVMRVAHVPVLAAPEDAASLPRTALIAMDFTKFSHDAARTAVKVLAPGGRVHLVHVLSVTTPEVPWVGGLDWIEEYRAGIPIQLNEFAHVLQKTADVHVETHVLEGDPGREVLGLAERVQADLIAAGSHGASFFSRILIGSVSTRLVRGATCTVLIAPPRTIPAELERSAPHPAEGRPDRERTGA